MHFLRCAYACLMSLYGFRTTVHIFPMFWYDFAYEIMKLNLLTCQVYPIPTESYPRPAARPSYSVMDKSKIKSHYNIYIPHWKESLAKCIQLLHQ